MRRTLPDRPGERGQRNDLEGTPREKSTGALQQVFTPGFYGCTSNVLSSADNLQ